MLKPNDSQLLELWERGYSRRSADRCVVMLSGCQNDGSVDDLIRLSIGEAERRLIEFRRTLFGDDAEVRVQCPECSESLELDVSLEQLLKAGSTENAAQQSLECELSSGVLTLFRVPRLGDLLEIQSLSPTEARDAILKRCVQAVDGADEPQLTESDVATVTKAMSTADPLANIKFEMTCPECGHSWQAPFRIATLLWQEINDWAQRLLLQIHTLATTYGWNQSDVLQLSRWRRQVYLNMAKQ